MSQDPSEFPLTRFLTALSHSPQLLERFRRNPHQVAADSGLTEEQVAMLVRGNIQEIQGAVSDEIGEEGAATVGWWIMVDEQQEGDGGGGGVPDWWIRSS